jgi:hypothetical protein
MALATAILQACCGHSLATRLLSHPLGMTRPRLSLASLGQGDQRAMALRDDLGATRRPEAHRSRVAA